MALALMMGRRFDESCSASPVLSSKVYAYGCGWLSAIVTAPRQQPLGIDSVFPRRAKRTRRCGEGSASLL